ncbi:uncharacterized protein LOC135690998 [Rhopilema esculentum]|uniref:uncharacterized protein LOC135690998 n=1 Tax=Rhopilema esculentum TaxID=499914 RepID=UPI0031D87152
MEELLEHRPWRTYLIFIALNILNAQITHSAKGTVQEVHIDSKFECKASHRLNLKASSEIQCVQRCAKNEKCELLNYNYQWKEKGIEENCEIYMLSRYDSSCKTAPNATGWKAAIYNDTEKCRYLKFNFCFPCNCATNNCVKEETLSCKCVADTPSLPTFFVSFESTLSDQTVAYDRGADKLGNSIITLKRDAMVGPSEGRIGNVLRLVGIDPAAVVGSFESHPLNNPNTGSSTFSFWIKLISATVATQTVFGSGKSGSNTGFLMKLKNYGKTIYAEGITGNRYRTLSYNIGNALEKWTHVAMVEHGDSDAQLRLYVNGIQVAISGALTSESVSTTLYSKLALGVDEELFTLNGKHYGLHIDDVAYWSIVLSDAEIKNVMKRDFASCLT